jgi:hypothetical protein
VLTEVSPHAIDEGVDMSIVRKFRTTRSTAARRGSSALARALASAPTPASRDELLQLQNMGR